MKEVEKTCGNGMKKRAKMIKKNEGRTKDDKRRIRKRKKGGEWMLRVKGVSQGNFFCPASGVTSSAFISYTKVHEDVPKHEE